MKLHELKIQHKYLIDVTIGKKTFELRKNDRDYQVGDLIRFIDIWEVNEATKIAIKEDRLEPYIDHNTLYKITYVLKDVEKYGLDKDYCILAIKKLDIKEVL